MSDDCLPEEIESEAQRRFNAAVRKMFPDEALAWLQGIADYNPKKRQLLCSDEHGLLWWQDQEPCP